MKRTIEYTRHACAHIINRRSSLSVFGLTVDAALHVGSGGVAVLFRHSEVGTRRRWATVWFIRWTSYYKRELQPVRSAESQALW